MKKILAIDDKIDNLITMEALLKSNIPHSTVITALSGKEGIKLATEQQPEVILLDIIMPEMDGYEVCKKLKSTKATKHIPIIMITAIATDTDSRVKGLNAGADAFLSKPINSAELTAQVRVMMRIRNAENKLRNEKSNLNKIVSKTTSDLENSRQKYKALYENAPLPYQSLDVDGKIIDVNLQWLQMLGYSSKEVIGKPFSNFLHTDWKKEFEQSFIKFKKVGYHHNNRLKMQCKNGHAIDILFDGTIGYNPDGSFKQTYCVFQDVSERKKIEDQLATTYAWQQTIFEGSRDAIFITNTNSELLMVNKAASVLTGYSNTDLLNMHIPDLHEDTDLDAYLLFHDKIMQGDEIITQSKIKRKDGQKVDVEFNNKRIKIGDDYYMHTSARDVTESNKDRAEVQRQNKFLTSTLEALTHPFRVIDANDYSVIMGNKASGFTPGQKKVSCYRLTHHNTEPCNDVDHPCPLEIIKKTHKPTSVEHMHYKNNGKLKVMEIHGYPIFDENDNLIQMIEYNLDVTERRRAELIKQIVFNISNASATSENLHSLAQSIQKELGNVINTHNFYIAMYDKNTDIISFPYYADEYVHFDSAPAKNTLTGYVIKTRKPLLANIKVKEKFIEEGLLVSQGKFSKVWLGVPLIVNDEAIGALAMQSYTNENAYDEKDMEMLEFVSGQISVAINRKKTEDDLKAALIKAKESDRLKSAFLANMSHEIRTPMNGILGFASLLNDPKLTGMELKKYVGIIEKGGVRMLNIINDLIDISKIEANQMEVFLSNCNVNGQMDYLHTFFKPEADKKGLELSFNCQLPANDALIVTDREKLFAILTNLIKNSIKYTHTGCIDFGYIKKDDYLEFYVKDTGIGIPKDRCNAIFERFVQADIEDRSVYEGAGLGLSISYAYVQMLGGKIWLKSEIGVGSQFYFTIPYNVGKIAPKDVPQKVTPDVVEQTSKLKILIVEDEAVATNFLTVVVNGFSSCILKATTGTQAVDLCKKNDDIDLILMDIRLPLMNGYEATHRIRKFNKNVIIIAQTAYALAGDYEKAIAAGCNDYISKPINTKHLKEMIHKYFWNL